MPEIGQPNSSEDANTRNAFFEILQLVNGQLDANNVADGSLDADVLAGAVREALGLTGGGQKRRGKSIVATEESRTDASYGTLATPDRVANLVVPADGVLFALFDAMWKNSVAGAGRAAIFINGVQFSRIQAGAAQAQEATGNTSANLYTVLTSFAGGLLGNNHAAAGGYPGNVATGQALDSYDTNATRGGLLVVHDLPAGSYTVEVRYKSTSGSVTAKNRKLRAWACGFD